MKKKKKRLARKSSNSIPNHKPATNVRWQLKIDSKEAASNFYSALHAFQRSASRGFIDAEALAYVNRWIDFIIQQDPGVVARTNDRNGPFRVRDVSPQDIVLEINDRERILMFFICRTLYKQLISPLHRENWIRNQGRLDYELAVKNYESWIDSLEGEGHPVAG